jgi:hypothetical protein
MGWSEKLYAAIEPADPYLDDGVLIVSGRYLLGAMAFGALRGKQLLSARRHMPPTVVRIAPQPVAVLGAVLPRCVSAVGRNHKLDGLSAFTATRASNYS